MLDPQRIGLNAASVGFLKRTGQNVDWASFNQALQTDDSRCADVRAEMETPVDELHVMGGQRFGLEGNSNLKMNARQERQINGYPLRSFSANAPAIILPDKYGGLPMYTRNQTEYSDFVSRYTAPLSTALQNDTVLLGRQGYSVTNESASHPYRDVGFEHNMHKSKDAIDYNEAMIKQRQWLQYQSQVAQKQKRGGKVTEMRMSSENGRGVRNAVDGIFISANGEPMTQVNSDSLGDMFYDDTTVKTDLPSEDPYLPGTDQLDPSADRTAQFLPAGRASNAIAAKVLSNRYQMDPDLLDIHRQQAAYGIARAWTQPQRTAFHKIFSYGLGNIGKPTKRQLLEGRGMEGADAESRANQIIMGVAFRNAASPNAAAPNSELIIDANPLSNQARVLSAAAFVPGGGQSLPLRAAPIMSGYESRDLAFGFSSGTEDLGFVTAAEDPRSMRQRFPRAAHAGRDISTPPKKGEKGMGTKKAMKPMSSGKRARSKASQIRKVADVGLSDW